MKSTTSSILLAVILGPMSLAFFGGCSRSDNAKISDSAQDAKQSMKDAATDVKDAAVDTWDTIKSYTWDRRSDFSASIDRMDNKMDEKIAEMKANATASSSAERSAAVRDYDDARADLKVRLNELSNATAETWVDAKIKVQVAWEKTKAAYSRATS